MKSGDGHFNINPERAVQPHARAKPIHALLESLSMLNAVPLPAKASTPSEDC
jgi:hypothetical protein